MRAIDYLFLEVDGVLTSPHWFDSVGFKGKEAVHEMVGDDQSLYEMLFDPAACEVFMRLYKELGEPNVIIVDRLALRNDLERMKEIIGYVKNLNGLKVVAAVSQYSDSVTKTKLVDLADIIEPLGIDTSEKTIMISSDILFTEYNIPSFTTDSSVGITADFNKALLAALAS